ncbi:hypothetical protein ACUOGZ_25465, partial [Escherichia coli]
GPIRLADSPVPALTVQAVNDVVPKGTPATFEVYASVAPSTSVTFSVTIGGTAGPADVLPLTGSLVIPAGQTSASFQVPTRLNGLVEPNRTVT